MKNYIEIRDQGYKSLDALVGLMAEVVDKMQEADVPVGLIRDKVMADATAILDAANKEQLWRWEAEMKAKAWRWDDV